MILRPFAVDEVPLEGLSLIEASAGTGKTFSLAGLYLRLLIEKNLGVDEILVVTFTRAATAELRERIRRRVDEAAQIARNPSCAEADNPEHGLALAMIEGSLQDRKQIAARLADAARRMDEAAIATIHGLAQRAAADNAFDSALPFDRGEPVDDRQLYAEVVADYWRSQALGPEARTGFAEHWPTPENLADIVTQFRLQPHARLAGPAESEISKGLARLKAQWQSGAEDYIALWEEIEQDKTLNASSDLGKALKELGGVRRALSALDSRMADNMPILPTWLSLLHKPRQFNARKGERASLLREHELTISLVQMAQMAPIALTRHAIQTIDAMADDRKILRRQFSYADLISDLHRAITDPDRGSDLAASLHRAWPYALVDEFQDTDPRQYEILQAIYKDRDVGALYLIGDPKQAIYGFRGGDVHAYLNAAADAHAQAFSLATNFRSSQALLDGIETVFRAPGANPFLVEGIEFQTVNAGRPDQRHFRIGDDTPAALTFWRLPEDSSTKPDAERNIRNACIAQISRLLNPETRAGIASSKDGQLEVRPLEPRDVAILVNTNEQASVMQQSLAMAGIAAVCLHQQSVFESGEATDLLHLLRAAASPTDEGKIRGALATDLLGYRFSQISKLIADESAWVEETGRFLVAHQRWRDAGILAMLQPMIQGAAKQLLLRPDGPRRVSNYLQLAELLAEASPKTFGMDGLLHWLGSAIRQASPQDMSDAEMLRLESDEALVRIATIHASKGLEYAAVFLPFAPWLGSAGSPHKPPLKLHARSHGALIDVAGLEGHAEQAAMQARAESLRTLYVALTRAQVACYLPWGSVNGAQNSALANLLHRDTIDTGSWYSGNSAAPLSHEVTREALERLASQNPESIRVCDLPGEPERVPRSLAPTAMPKDTARARHDLPQRRAPWSITSFTKLASQTAGLQDTAGASDESVGGQPVIPLSGSGLPGGTDFGTAVHLILENEDPQSWPDEPQKLHPTQLQTVARVLRRHGIVVPEGEPGEIMILGTAGLVCQALHTPLPGIGTLASVAPTARRPELQFTMRLGDSRIGELLDLLTAAGHARHLNRERAGESLQGLMQGHIDLIIESDGRFHVLDYKTNWLGPGPDDYQASGLELAIAHHHYDLQYLIYLTALHRYLAHRLPDYAIERHLGAAYYLFLRGMHPTAGQRGIYREQPKPQLILSLDALLDGNRR